VAVTRLDTQQVELIGRNLLVSVLLRDGLEVARPERDRGVDVIAYIDLPDSGGWFIACPIQMKAYSAAGFSVESKYGRFPGLLIAHLWNVAEPSAFESYCLTYPESLDVAERMAWTATASWKTGAYSTTNPSRRLRALLQKYRMEPGGWAAKVQSASARPSASVVGEFRDS
jgi:hypothetical protein